ncbi:MAG: hypothetical protein Q9163_000528 [Psora crenata]
MGSNSDDSLRNLLTTAKSKAKDLESFTSTTDTAYQEELRAAIDCLERCRQIADRISLFSPNETLEDIASTDIHLILKDSAPNRKQILRRAQEAYARYLHLLDTYLLLSKSDSELYERYIEDTDGFSLIQTSDAATRRNIKISRFRQEKDLKQKLEHLAQNPGALQSDDNVLRELFLAEVELSTHQTFQTLDMIAQEFKTLALKPSTPPPGPTEREADYRERNGLQQDTHSDRLAHSLSQLYQNRFAGPLLSKDGKPLQPFTLLDSRQRLQNGVFKPDHALPTMTIDEYLAEEKRRGGIIDGGGEQSGPSAEPNEDDMEKADIETMKARGWDDFTEANPKGSGNTINRG